MRNFLGYFLAIVIPIALVGLVYLAAWAYMRFAYFPENGF